MSQVLSSAIIEKHIPSGINCSYREEREGSLCRVDKSRHDCMWHTDVGLLEFRRIMIIDSFYMAVSSSSNEKSRDAPRLGDFTSIGLKQ